MGLEVRATGHQTRVVCIAIAALLVAVSAQPRLAAAAFTAFESGHVRGLTLSADRTRLYALNTPDNRLEIFEVSDAGVLHLSSVPVGLEPVAVAERVPGEVWVVNRISDDVSIVSTSGTPRVVRTLLVGDEPSDVVFGGVGRSRAFVATARRGQNSPIDAQYLMPGIGRALVFVFDATDLGASAGGEPIEVLELFGDAPRALATNASGTIVYAAIFHSGNRTITIPASVVSGAGVTLLPNMSANGQQAPPPSQIVRFDDATGQWRDDEGRNWSAFVPFTLPDADVFAFDANASPAAMQASVMPYANVGTVLFNMAVNPADGHVFVTNSEARNERRFEGAGAALTSFPLLPQKTVRGRLHQYRVTVIDPGTSTVTPRHLNKHIDYDLTPEATAATDTADRSLATPLDVVIDASGNNLYVAAFGSDKVGVFSPDELEDDSFTPDDADHIAISGGGPTSLALDEPRNRLYVLARFEQSISVVDLTNHPGTEIASVPLPHDPEPPSVRTGRRFLYDARLTSSNGEASCSSCHIFGGTDDLAWNLGDPDGVTRFSPNMQAISTWKLDQLAGIDNLAQLLHQQDFLPDGFFLEHHPLKGPLFTKSLRGLANGGPMHWGGDRTGGGVIREDPNSLDEDAAFKTFNGAFRSLMGRTGPLSAPEMQAFTDFMLQVVYPPNPNRALDNSLTPAQANARNIFLNVPVHSTVPAETDVFTCSSCHTLDPAAGLFGSGGKSSFRSGRTQVLKVPHLRSLYSLAGMFGIVGGSGPTGAQIRGVGLQHDATVDTLLSFVEDHRLRFPGANEAAKAQNRLDMVELLLAFDTESAPVLGQQVTLDDAGPGSSLLPFGASTVQERVDLLASRALVTTPIPECDLIVKAAFDGEPRGWWQSGANLFRPDRDGAPDVTLAALQTHAETPGRELTFLCVPPGSGERLGIDRNADGTRDGSQCGDVNLDGVVATNDATLLRRALARVPGAALPLARKCNALGPRDLGDANGDGVPDDCDILDVAVLARDAVALAPGAAQVCASAESCAVDPDGDVVCGSVDNCPTVANPDQADADGDGLGDACDTCPTDVENDPDTDGVCDSIDNCPGVANPGQANADADPFGDACDTDDDEDSHLDGADNCPLIANAGQENADADAFGDACDTCPADAANDADADGLCADVDNCPAVANPGQENADADAFGDACDTCPLDAANDADADGLCADVDNCPAVANPGQEDTDEDGLGDACDP
jgi:DNA-binding beta-propeller fold protein YncE